jgi:beta-galactosidase
VNLRLNELRRQTPVHLVVPRSLRRLHRVLHAFGPLSAVLFQIMGRSAIDAGLEDELDLGAPFAIDADRFLRWFEEELEKRRIPFAVVGGDLIEHSLEHARWTIIACPGGLEQKIVKAVSRGLKSGLAVSIGPHFPQRDETLVPREPPSALRHAFGSHELPTLLEFEPERLAVAIDHAVEVLNLPLLVATPDEIQVSVHHDVAGTARVLFVINPTAEEVLATVGACGANSAEDALDGTHVHARFGAFELPIPPRTVRMLALRF